jgi:redox-sensing transcriptional repressor
MISRSIKKNRNANTNQIPNATIRRLSLYYRTLDLLENYGLKTISSQKLGMFEGITGAQIRRDLNYFGSFGKRGMGYDISFLKTQIAKILGLDRKWNIILIGSVQFSTVLNNSAILKKKNLTISKLFDNSPEFVGKEISGITISHIDNLEKEVEIGTDDLAIVAVPPPEVQAVINRLANIGLRGALYFASRSIEVPDNMVILNEDISIELGIITFQMTHMFGLMGKTAL